MSTILLTISVVVIAYLLGCISTGILISKHAGVNIRNAGSKNTGASNVLRVMGVRDGAITFLGDSLKAVAACWLGSVILPGSTFGIERFGVMIAGMAVIAGHNWPCFFSFKGGKGVASSTAVLLFVDPLLGGIAIAICVLLIWLTKYISLGSMAMLFSFLVLNCIFRFDQWFACVFAGVLFIVAMVRHRANIKRLMQGTENKIGKKADANLEQK